MNHLSLFLISDDHNSLLTWFAVGLTTYFVTQFLVLNYVRKLSHLRPLWFANVANNILWFTFVKACWRAAGAACGKSLTFKTTIKGANALMNSAIGDLWVPTLVLAGCLASFGKPMFFHYPVRYIVEIAVEFITWEHTMRSEVLQTSF